MVQFKNERDRVDVLNCLRENMNEEFQATLQYICHRISAKGVDETLSDSFKSAALDEMSHILFFSDLSPNTAKHLDLPHGPLTRALISKAC